MLREQQQLPTDTTAGFQTDEQLAVRVGQIENGLHHLEATIPSMRRELAAIRRILQPDTA